MKLLHQKILKILEKEKIEFSLLDDKTIVERLRHLLGYFRFGKFLFHYISFNSLSFSFLTYDFNVLHIVSEKDPQMKVKMKVRVKLQFSAPRAGIAEVTKRYSKSPRVRTYQNKNPEAVFPKLCTLQLRTCFSLMKYRSYCRGSKNDS